MKLSKEEHEKRLTLFNQGLNNYEIAERCHTTPNAIAIWKTTNGLHSPKPTINEDLAVEMFDDGASDQEIADAMGVTSTMVCSWRLGKRLLRLKRMDDVVISLAESRADKRKRRENQHNISEDNAKARNNGLSYGEYKAGVAPKQRYANFEGWKPFEVRI